MRIAWVLGLVVCALVTPAVATDTPTAPPNRGLADAEETYELRIERVQNTKGNRAVFEMLTHDLAERPRPYVKAWYANFLLYAPEFGLPEVADTKRGFALAKESSAEGSAFGTELVGRAYGDARGPGYRDTTDALKYLNQAADRGRATALCEVARYYFFGINVREDRARAEELARRGAWLGATVGLSRLAKWYDDPNFSSTPDHAKAVQLHYEAAEYGSRSDARVLQDLAAKGDRVAEKYLKLEFVVDAEEGSRAYPTQLKAVVKWLEANAAPDDIPVQLALAELMSARSGPVYDAKLAREKLARAAAAGSDDAR